MKMLLIEDERALAAGIVAYLNVAGIQCETAATFAEAEDKTALYRYDCIMLDLSLPGGDGLRLLESMRQAGRADSVIIITARDGLDDRIQGLNLGADDYMSKPFHLAELLARIHAVIRRKQFDGGQNILIFNELTIDLQARTAAVHERPLELTRSEFDLLLYLAGNRRRVVSKSAIAEHLSGDMADMLDRHDFVYAHIKNLKKKLARAGCNDYIKTIYGLGYQWLA